MSMHERLARFARKSPREQWLALCFAVRRRLVTLPFLPNRISLGYGPDAALSFWWSYMLPGFDSTKQTWAYRGPDEAELQFLCRLVRPGMCFFDIGAYHGLYGIVAGAKVEGNLRLVFFEPSARARQRIHLHLRLNRLQADVEPFALGARCGRQSFFVVSAGFTTMSSLTRPPIDHPTQEIQVETITLDTYCEEKNIHQVDVIKIDVEGGERELFKGARRVLTSFRPLILCEVLDWVTKSWGYQAREIIFTLKQYGYEWFEFAKDGRLLPHKEQASYPEVRNYLAVPCEKRAMIQPVLVNAVP
jgi:FkbM family methyltransferase